MKKLAKAMVVPVRQRTQYTCVPCSLSMCLRALGLDWITEDIVNEVMGARPMKGATWEQVLATAQHFGKRGTLTSPCTVEQLKEWTDQGIPVMIAYNPEGRDWSHASVVFHVDSDTVYVADPNIPDPSEFVREFSWKEFYGVWYEKWPNYLVRRPAMAISHEISESGQQVPHPNLRMAMKKTAGSDYMSKQNIRDSLRMCKDLVLWVDGENMEDWVEDKLSVIRAALSDVHRFYENGHWDIGKQKITLWVDENMKNVNMRKASVRVADRYLKTAGGEWFMEYDRGNDPKKLFRRLRQSAFDEYELDMQMDAAEEGEEWEYDGYSGTMFEKNSFKIVSNDPKPLKFFTYQNLEKAYGSNPKWGPAFAAPYSRREGGAIEGWVFWGVASS